MKILQKLMLISRIQVFYAKSLISKKYLFMSVKYRALKVSICSFRFAQWLSIYGKIENILKK